MPYVECNLQLLQKYILKLKTIAEKLEMCHVSYCFVISVSQIQFVKKQPVGILKRRRKAVCVSGLWMPVGTALN